MNISSYALDLSLSDWKQWAQDHGFPSFTGSQIYQWIFSKKNLAPKTYTNLSLDLRDKLTTSFNWTLPEIDSHLVSIDKSEKFLFKSHDGQLFEMVLMPYENRVTLCISCQIGCRMGCTFCQTGKMGLKRNLSSGEILSQLHVAHQAMINNGQNRRVSNVVFMGMGEPLDNYQEIVKACRTMIDPKGYGLSKNHVTVSTSGLVPEIRQLGKDLPVRLAISLHNADDTKRSKMMPVNRKYDLNELKKVLKDYPAPKRYGVTFEYVMIEGDNDSMEDAKKLADYLTGIRSKVNLIPINNFPGMEMQASKKEKLLRFQAYLIKRGIPTSIRYSRGQDISGGCGQLATKRSDELDLDPRVVQKRRRQEDRDKLKVI